jgi:diguanylate cyclase (GGDEF)-like protein
MFRLEPGRDVEIGRRPESEVLVQDPGVSRRHATIRVDELGATVRDLGSRNGTFVNGHARPEARVGDGGRIQIGASTTLRFAMSDATEAEFQSRLADAALRDPLTGLYNRMILSQRIAAAVTAYPLQDKPLALLVLDIDFFKKVNDQHGHIAGDEVLKNVAAAVKRAVRADDLVARWGGEEFMVLARDTGLAGACTLAEKIRAAAAAATTVWRGAELTVTLSVGVAALSTARHVLPETAERVLIEAADRALYLAKKCGRNRVEAQEVGR